ncbi:uncharacterized protein LOC143216706 [Lasioglossum baleicum]|uniref:uncharacterized protein LOC143216706 n=1 Tax=Lasioglossum baleicum TaxID=434251 RepID=UPI003FCCE5DB
MDQGEPSGVSPQKRNPRGKYVLSGQKEMIINLYKKLKQENAGISYKAIIESLTKTTGIGICTVKYAIAEYKSTGAVSSPNMKRRCCSILEKTLEADILAIRRKVHDFWVRREVPNLDKILQAVNDDEELPSFSRSSLHRLLKGMEFRFIKRKRNSALIDKQHIVSWRQNYIKNIRELREEGRPIYYLDETWYNCGDVVNKLWVDTTVTSPRNAEERRLSTGLPAPANKGKRLIILHIGSEDGFLPGGLLCFESKKILPTTTMR